MLSEEFGVRDKLFGRHTGRRGMSGNEFGVLAKEFGMRGEEFGVSAKLSGMRGEEIFVRQNSFTMRQKITATGFLTAQTN